MLNMTGYSPYSRSVSYEPIQWGVVAFYMNVKLIYMRTLVSGQPISHRFECESGWCEKGTSPVTPLGTNQAKRWMNDYILCYFISNLLDFIALVIYFLCPGDQTNYKINALCRALISKGFMLLQLEKYIVTVTSRHWCRWIKYEPNQDELTKTSNLIIGVSSSKMQTGLPCNYSRTLI